MMANEFEVKTYKRFNFQIVSGKGSYITTSDGRQLLDLYGGHAVASTGHCHSHVVKAICQQAEQLLFYSNVLDLPIRNNCIRRFGEILPGNLNKIFLVNSGSEANDNAIKIARKHTSRKKILSFDNSFHGRTLTAISATGIKNYQKEVVPLVPEHLIFPSSNWAQIQAQLETREFAAVILEPIQSMGGMFCHGREFLENLLAKCKEVGSLVIYDEVQTGMGRTGNYFYAHKPGLCPDILTAAKGIASGVPVGAVVVSNAINNDINFGDLGSTFGGGPLACAAISATIDVIESENLLKNATRMESYLRKELSTIGCVEEVLGEGLLLGIKFQCPARQAQQFLLERNIITGLSVNPYVLRIMPPLNLAKEDAKKFVSSLRLYHEEQATKDPYVD